MSKIREEIIDNLTPSLQERINEDVLVRGMSAREAMDDIVSFTIDFDHRMKKITYNYAKYLEHLKKHEKSFDRAFEKFIDKMEERFSEDVEEDTKIIAKEAEKTIKKEEKVEQTIQDDLASRAKDRQKYDEIISLLQRDAGIISDVETMTGDENDEDEVTINAGITFDPNETADEETINALPALFNDDDFTNVIKTPKKERVEGQDVTVGDVLTEVIRVVNDLKDSTHIRNLYNDNAEDEIKGMLRSINAALNQFQDAYDEVSEKLSDVTDRLDIIETRTYKEITEQVRKNMQKSPDEFSRNLDINDAKNIIINEEDTLTDDSQLTDFDDEVDTLRDDEDIDLGAVENGAPTTAIYDEEGERDLTDFEPTQDVTQSDVQIGDIVAYENSEWEVIDIVEMYNARTNEFAHRLKVRSLNDSEQEKWIDREDIEDVDDTFDESDED
ncbi:hypothetical protein [Mesoplasma lactucae]|uniref:Uncharacterized protein n=1 Tax=Mesoplasma lactucae ATCC 49193 TaxID=81460 RepID=A0A291IRS8_9MOLU|nr:hypothetical protein [Mesoplasma lactucae]ATG97416.1 hypothetical protein CP520_01415 [Mesoplasma lactucae ATCC 49193]ATZ20131.1 hypothetical protein MLACT_v1c03100 [Mesoplasma lactucae ATCC 49193]MCL8216879.1 hypothetical protein [Mesoplasma lactucae ATCC 49193]